jgi:hypothetical protein
MAALPDHPAYQPNIAPPESNPPTLPVLCMLIRVSAPQSTPWIALRTSPLCRSIFTSTPPQRRGCTNTTLETLHSGVHAYPLQHDLHTQLPKRRKSQSGSAHSSRVTEFVVFRGMPPGDKYGSPGGIACSEHPPPWLLMVCTLRIRGQRSSFLMWSVRQPVPLGALSCPGISVSCPSGSESAEVLASFP